MAIGPSTSSRVTGSAGTRWRSTETSTISTRATSSTIWIRCPANFPVPGERHWRIQTAAASVIWLLCAEALRGRPHTAEAQCAPLRRSDSSKTGNPPDCDVDHNRPQADRPLMDGTERSMPRDSNEGLNMDSSQSFLPHTFPDPGYAGFKVTVSDDRSIKVRQGDWLSKYSMAIYGDFDHVDKFRRKDGSVYVKVTDKDLIKTGEVLYHPDALPGESSGEGTGGSEPPLQARYVAEFFYWIRNMFVPTEWTVLGSGLVPSEYGQVGIIGMKDIDPWLPGVLQPT